MDKTKHGKNILYLYFIRAWLGEELFGATPIFLYSAPRSPLGYLAMHAPIYEHFFVTLFLKNPFLIFGSKSQNLDKSRQLFERKRKIMYNLF